MSDSIECADCHAMFEFAAGEQRFFETRGLRDQPRRCAACRDARKRRFRDRDHTGPAARDPRRSARHAEPLSIAEPAAATQCACCGLPAEVEFRAAIGRPVYCQQCYNFRQKDGAGWRG